jgi:TonB-dependent receptor
MKRLLLLFFSIGISFAALAQRNGVISGKITELESNISLPGATIRLLNADHRYTVSDQIGSFEFLNIPAGRYELEVLYIGYQTQRKDVVVKEGENTLVNLALGNAAESLNNVVITGERLKGQARALNQQKTNMNISNVISSDQAGRFPDANIGDALKRVPGITMQNDQGEARNIIIRGLAPALNSVTLNGDRIPSAEGDNRNVQMDLIPSDMIATMEVNKTLTPDMDADAIGGSVNLVTRASPNGERISATLAGGYNPIRGKQIYTGGLVYGNRFFNDKVGMVASGSYNNNDFGSDNIEAVWVKDEFNNTYVQEFDIRKYDVQRIRRSAALALDYKINDNNTIFANAIYNWRDDRENRFRTTYDDIEPQYDGQTITGFTGRIKRETKGGIDNSRNKSRRLEDQRVQNYALRGEHLVSPRLDLDWSVNYAAAREFRPNERYIEFEQEDLEFTQTGSSFRKPLVTALGANNNALFSQSALTENRDNTGESELGAKLNVRFPFSVISGQKGRLRTGLRMRLKDKKRDNIFYSYDPASETNLAGVPNSYFDGKGFNPGSQYVPGAFASAAYLGNLDLNNTTLFEGQTDPSEYLAVNYKAKEKIYAGYIRWDQDFSSKLSMILGARVENTRIDYTGNRVLDEQDLEGQINTKNAYTNILPGVTFKYDPTDDLVLRAAFTTALARPDYYALAPYVNNIAADSEIQAGNPELNATYSYNYDFMAENYFKSVGLISGGFFYKKLTNFIYTYSNSQYSTGDFANDFPQQSNPIPQGEQWTFMQSRNGDNVAVYGFEVAFQRQLDFLPGKFLKGFGIYANYTRTKSKARGIADEDGNERKNISLPGTAPHMLNGSLFWENSRFSARISANYTSGYLDALGADEFQDSYYDKQFFLDMNASYKFAKHIRFFAEANNLTNQPLRYYQGSPSMTKQLEYYQGRYNFGLKFDF